MVRRRQVNTATEEHIATVLAHKALKVPTALNPTRSTQPAPSWYQHATSLPPPAACRRETTTVVPRGRTWKGPTSKPPSSTPRPSPPPSPRYPFPHRPHPHGRTHVPLFSLCSLCIRPPVWPGVRACMQAEIAKYNALAKRSLTEAAEQPYAVIQMLHKANDVCYRRSNRPRTRSLPVLHAACL